MKVMVFDVGGTEIKYSVMDEQMNRFDSGSVPTPQDTQEHFLDTIYALYAPHKDEVDGIAMALPGFVDANTGYVSNGGDAPMNGKLFFEAANAGEPEALEVLERFCRMVAVQIYNLTVLLDVEKVAIGGGISKQPLLLDDLRRVYAGLFASRGESPYMIGLPRCEIVPCHFSSEANQVGALYTYLQAESKTI